MQLLEQRAEQRVKGAASRSTEAEALKEQNAQELATILKMDERKLRGAVKKLQDDQAKARQENEESMRLQEELATKMKHKLDDLQNQADNDEEKIKTVHEVEEIERQQANEKRKARIRRSRAERRKRKQEILRELMVNNARDNGTFSKDDLLDARFKLMQVDAKADLAVEEANRKMTDLEDNQHAEEEIHKTAPDDEYQDIPKAPAKRRRPSGRKRGDSSAAVAYMSGKAAGDAGAGDNDEYADLVPEEARPQLKPGVRVTVTGSFKCKKKRLRIGLQGRVHSIKDSGSAFILFEGSDKISSVKTKNFRYLRVESPKKDVQKPKTETVESPTTDTPGGAANDERTQSKDQTNDATSNEPEEVEAEMVDADIVDADTPENQFYEGIEGSMVEVTMRLLL